MAIKKTQKLKISHSELTKTPPANESNLLLEFCQSHPYIAFLIFSLSIALLSYLLFFMPRLSVSNRNEDRKKISFPDIGENTPDFPEIDNYDSGISPITAGDLSTSLTKNTFTEAYSAQTIQETDTFRTEKKQTKKNMPIIRQRVKREKNYFFPDSVAIPIISKEDIKNQIVFYKEKSKFPISPLHSGFKYENINWENIEEKFLETFNNTMKQHPAAQELIAFAVSHDVKYVIRFLDKTRVPAETDGKKNRINIYIPYHYTKNIGAIPIAITPDIILHEHIHFYHYKKRYITASDSLCREKANMGYSIPSIFINDHSMGEYNSFQYRIYVNMRDTILYASNENIALFARKKELDKLTNNGKAWKHFTGPLMVELPVEQYFPGHFIAESKKIPSKIAEKYNLPSDKKFNSFEPKWMKAYQKPVRTLLSQMLSAVILCDGYFHHYGLPALDDEALQKPRQSISEKMQAFLECDAIFYQCIPIDFLDSRYQYVQQQKDYYTQCNIEPNGIFPRSEENPDTGNTLINPCTP